MRLFLIFVALVVVAAIGAAIYFRSVAMPAEVWHVEPAAVVPPDTPNFVLLTGEEAPVIDLPAALVARHLDAQAAAERADLIAGSVTRQHMTYVARSRLMGYPDAISVRLVPVEGADGPATRVEIFSRSRFGYSDMGVNEARVARWLAAVQAQSAP